MEKSKPNNKLITKFFLPVEMALIGLATIAVYFLYGQTPGSVLLPVIVFTILAVLYLFKAFVRDPLTGIKPRIIYFTCSIPCIAILFALMEWKTYHLLLVGGLICMAIGWGVFVWANYRKKDQQRAARQASGYMMFFRLILYTAACLLLLLTDRIA